MTAATTVQRLEQEMTTHYLKISLCFALKWLSLYILQFEVKRLQGQVVFISTEKYPLFVVAILDKELEGSNLEIFF